MKSLFALSGGALMCAAIALTAQVLAAEPTVYALKLLQNHSYWGDNETIVSPQGVRINNLGRMHFCIVAKSPDWSVTIFRDDDKTCYRQNLKNFVDTGMVADFIVRKQDRIVGRSALVKDKMVAHTMAKHYEDAIERCDYLPAPKFLVPQAEAVLFAYYKTPTNNGISLAYARSQHGKDWMTGLERGGAMNVVMTTSSIETTTVPVRIFDAPKNYKLVKSPQEVIMSKENREASGDVDEIFETKRR